jgi:hypothetical protein
VRSYLADPDGRKSAQRKAVYRGVCEICGQPTSGGDGPGQGPRRRCALHPVKRWDEKSALAAMLDWRRETGEFPSGDDLNRTLARKRKNVKALKLLATGNYPTSRTLARIFGSLPAARAAAESSLPRRARKSPKGD